MLDLSYGVFPHYQNYFKVDVVDNIFSSWWSNQIFGDVHFISVYINTWLRRFLHCPSCGFITSDCTWSAVDKWSQLMRVLLKFWTTVESLLNLIRCRIWSGPITHFKSLTYAKFRASKLELNTFGNCIFPMFFYK